MDFLSDLAALNDDVNSGRLSGITRWNETKGRCTLMSVDIEENASTGKKSFVFILNHAAYGTGKFSVRIPTTSDKSTAQYMAMQTIRKTIYACACTDAKINPMEAFKAAQKMAGKQFNYELREWEQVSQANGNTYINQSLELLIPVAGATQSMAKKAIKNEDDVPF